MTNWLKKVNDIKSTNTSDLVKKTVYNTKINEIEKKLLIMIMLNMLLFKDLITYRQIILLQD